MVLTVTFASILSELVGFNVTWEAVDVPEFEFTGKSPLIGSTEVSCTVGMDLSKVRELGAWMLEISSTGLMWVGGALVHASVPRGKQDKVVGVLAMTTFNRSRRLFASCCTRR